jgi:hypothetical protein
MAMKYYQNNLGVMLLVMLIFNGMAIAQPGSVLSNFTAQKNENKIFINWTITAGNTCNGIFVFRSTDSVHYQNIGAFYGVCGSEIISQQFTFTDSSPIPNKRNFYTLQLGNTWLNQVVSLFFLANGSVLLAPNPVKQNIQLYFENSKKSKAQVTIFNYSGMAVLSGTTQDNTLSLSTASLNNGIYNYSLLVGNERFSGKFIVNKE